MPFDAKQAVAGALTVGMFVMLGNMIGNGPLNFSSPEETALMAAGNAEVLGESTETVIKRSRRDDTPKELWGKQGSVLQPCWNKHITGRQGRTWGYVMVRLSNGPQYHALQVADAVIVARYLGATLLLPTIKEAPKEPNSEFDKIYDVNNFISSLKDVVRVVGRLPEDVRGVQPTIVKVPYKVTSEYIEENVQPVFKQNSIIQLMTVLSAASLRAKDTSDEETQAIRCLVTYSALRFHSQVQKLGERVISRVREGGEASGGRFIAVDLRVDVLKQRGCDQSANGKSKKCFNGQEVGTFLRRLGFSSETAVYLTQSRWDSSLDALKEAFPNVYTKEYSMPFNEEKQILYSGNTQFEKAIDFYVCTHSDVFVPAISGLSYVSIAGKRIALGKTQIYVPMLSEDASKLKVSAALSKFVTKKDHTAYSCFCK
ncbi:hypothetical protein L7F22_036967 [Adiantum nelumboides]|nr:hypothetical protein [Adiantum nelumboides]